MNLNHLMDSIWKKLSQDMGGENRRRDWGMQLAIQEAYCSLELQQTIH